MPMLKLEDVLSALKIKKINKRFVALLAAVLAAGGAALFYLDNGLLHGHKSAEVEIASGYKTADIAEALYKNGIIKSKLVFKLASRLSGSDASYRSGIVTLRSDMSYFEIIRQLKSNARFTKVTIPEGYELGQIADELASKGLIDKDRFYAEVENGSFSYPFITAELPKGKNRLEGYLYPATYNIFPGDSEHKIIDMMLKRFSEGYPDSYKARAKELGFTTHQIITLASIIQREASSQMDIVSSVFHNRLKSKNYKYLQSCATVVYVTKEKKARLSVQDTMVDSPYNTYRHPGLPPGPIASPGDAAIKAALYPADTDYLFFTSIGNDRHIFSRTYQEHMAATEAAKAAGN